MSDDTEAHTTKIMVHNVFLTKFTIGVAPENELFYDIMKTMLTNDDGAYYFENKESMNDFLKFMNDMGVVLKRARYGNELSIGFWN